MHKFNCNKFTTTSLENQKGHMLHRKRNRMLRWTYVKAMKKGQISWQAKSYITALVLRVDKANEKSKALTLVMKEISMFLSVSRFLSWFARVVGRVEEFSECQNCHVLKFLGIFAQTFSFTGLHVSKESIKSSWNTTCSRK